MKTRYTAQLYDRATSVNFYEKRFSRGYIEDWPVEKKRKITAIIKSLRLPQEGEALDFGCGNGVLTALVQQALPNWKIYGTDISKTAINNAKSWFPGCIFFVVDDSNYQEKKFDFVFTHHVFEHVFNLQKTFNQMESFLKRTSWMLHILPCGNEGSFEHNICVLRKDGIDRKMENRFFYEDKGHVRRLNSQQFCQLAEAKGYGLQKEYYSYQYYGAIEWLTRSKLKFVLKFTDSSQAIDHSAKYQLRKLRIFLITITCLRLPAQIINTFLNKRKKRIKHYLLAIFALPLYVFSVPIDLYWKKKAKEEWDNSKTERNGSEMALFFKRDTEEPLTE